MQTHSKGICLQIGLMTGTELEYLAEPNWEHEIKPHFQVPQDIINLYPEWEYYGVDADPCSIAFLLQNKPTHPNIHYIQACLGATREIVSFPSWLSVENVEIEPPKTFLTPTISLNSLIHLLPVNTIDVLWLDIEGYELSVLSSYNWEVRPKYLSVE